MSDAVPNVLGGLGFVCLGAAAYLIFGLPGLFVVAGVLLILAAVAASNA